MIRRLRRWIRDRLMTCRRCGHCVDLHSHNRPGSDCAAAGCTCKAFR